MIKNLNLMMFIGGTSVAVITTLLCAHIPRRNHFSSKAAVLTLLLLCYIFLAPLEKMGVFIHLPIMTIVFLYVGICYQVTVPEALFIGIAGYTIEHIASLVDSILSLTDPRRFAHFGVDVETNIWGYALIAVCYISTVALAYILIIRRMQGFSVAKHATGRIITLSAVMLVVNQMLGLTFELYGAPYAGPLLSFLEYLWNLICCIFCLCIQFGIFEISQKERELEIARQLIAEKEQQYAISKSTIDAINRKCHNLKYELAALSAGKDGQKHIDEAMALVDSFVCMIDGAKLDFMDATDQYVLFGNLIDNAVNAVQQMDDPASRSIYLNIHVEKGFLLIRTENPFKGNLRFQDGLPLTTSGDEENHGFGMTSIQIITDKYGGSISTRAENQVFYLNILFPFH